MSSAKSMRLTVKEVILVSQPLQGLFAAAPFIAGYIAADDVHLSWPLAIGAFYFFAIHNLFLQGIEEVFGYHGNARKVRSTHLLPLSKHQALLGAVLLASVPFWLYFILASTIASSVFFGVMLLTALSYSVQPVRFKEVPLLDSVASAFNYTSPFIFGVLFAEGVNLWIPAWIAFFLWAMGNHVFRAIQDSTTDRLAGISSVATKLGTERTLALALALYAVAAILPILEYGVKGWLPSLVLSMYIVLVANTVPKRNNPGHSLFRQSWHLLTALTYVNGVLVLAYLAVLTQL